MLSVWLPLNKNLRNQGLIEHQINPTTLGSASLQTGGPFGKYLQVNTGNTQTTNGLRFSTNLVNELGRNFSVSVWVNPNGQHVHYEGAIISSGNWNTPNGRWAFGVSQDNTAIDVFGPGYTTYVTCSVPAGQWTHIVSTFEDGIGKVYKNGAYVGSRDFGTATFSSDTTTFCVGRETYANGYFGFNGNIADLRIYNHVLRDWEVKKIYNSCMYEMESGLYLPETTNLVTGFTRGGQTTIVNNNEIHTTGVNKDTYFTIKLSESIVPDTVYTISCYADMPNGTYWNFPLGVQTNTSLLWKIEPGYNTYTFTANNISWGDKQIFMDDVGGPARTSGQVCKFYNFQVEKREYASPYSSAHRSEAIADTSGLGGAAIPYNLGLSGSSIYLNGTDASIQVPITNIITGGTWSINIWFYRPSGMWGTKSWETLIGGQSGFEFSSKRSTTNSPMIVAYSWGQGSSGGAAYEYDKWNMVTMTRTPSQFKAYLNGENILTSTTVGSNPAGDYFIGAWKTNAQQNFKGYMRRFSIYKKELTAEDIVNLYIHNE